MKLGQKLRDLIGRRLKGSHCLRPTHQVLAVVELLLPTLTALAGVMKSLESGATWRRTTMQDLVGTVVITSLLNKDWVEHKTIIEPLTRLEISRDKWAVLISKDWSLSQRLYQLWLVTYLAISFASAKSSLSGCFVEMAANSSTTGSVQWHYQRQDACETTCFQFPQSLVSWQHQVNMQLPALENAFDMNCPS